MELKKRIGIIAGKVYRDINRDLLKGVLEQAFTLGFSASVFMPTEEFYDERIENAEYNILRLINFSMFDGVIYLPHTFASSACRVMVSDFLRDNCTVPVVCTDAGETPFNTVWYDERSETAEMVRHLIRVHSCKKIYYITGPEWMTISQNRLAGFKDAMDEAGLPYTDEDIMYGDLWVDFTQAFARELAEGRKPMPDAIACANDCMAISLFDALAELGISVPEQVRITGYDGTVPAAMHVPSISTYRSSWRSLGISAMRALYRDIMGKEPDKLCPQENGSIAAGESCGCTATAYKTLVNSLNYEKIEGDYQDSSLSTALLSAENYKSFIEALYRMEYYLLDSQRFADMHYCLCLCEDWNRQEMDGYEERYRTEGYTETMYATDTPGSHTLFSSKDMLPEHLIKEVPSVTYFTPSHFNDRCFGYHTFTLYGIADSFELKYMRFCREVNNALAFLVMQDALKSLAYNSHIARSRDLLTGLYNLERFSVIWNDITENAVLYNKGIYMIVVSLKGLDRIEEISGTLECDKLLVGFSEILMKSCGRRETVISIGRGDFAIIGTKHRDSKERQNVIETIEELFKDINTSYTAHIRHIEKELSSGDFPEADAARSMLLELAESISEERTSRSEQLYYKELVVLRREIFEFPGREWNLPICSGKLNISTTYFQKIYRKAFGVTCMHDIQKSKLDYAKKLLTHTNDTLQAIAEQCGYDYSHFMRMFKKDTGLTPTEYRRGKR